MCGRYTLTTPPDDLLAVLGVEQSHLDFQPRYNIAPTQDAPVVARNPEGVLGALDMRWGLVPLWADDPAIGDRMINARAETAHKKPAFRAAFSRRRCLVLTDGFYEWQKQNGGPKQPYWITAARQAWTDPETDVDDLRGLLRPAPDDLLEPRPVSTYVNRPQNNGPECIEAVDPAGQ